MARKREPNYTEIVSSRPGSMDAKIDGCRCSPIHNGFGRGAPMRGDEGTAVFDVARACPMHGQGTPYADINRSTVNFV